MRVYLIQHGESKSEEKDPQRRLTDKGIDEVQAVADFASKVATLPGLQPEVLPKILTSVVDCTYPSV
jgi:phosphohistidine phosphatase SixA